jgi:hypothetical protein
MSIFIYSCQLNSPAGRRAKLGFGTWDISDSTVQFHKYNKTGLLDSSLKVWYHFKNGHSDLHLNTLVTREYDSLGELKTEQSFNYLSHSNKWSLTSKDIKKYDKKGNIVLDVELDVKNSKNIMSSLTKRLYNSNNQEIIRFEVRQKMELDPPNWTIDSALAHYDDEQVLKYDTSKISYSYDGSGMLVTETYSRPEHPAEETLSSTYSEGIKQSTISTTSTGDTNTIYTYTKEGNLLRETKDYKTYLPHSIDTTWFRGNNKVKSVSYYIKSHLKRLKLYKYDAKGNQIGEITYH